MMGDFSKNTEEERNIDPNFFEWANDFLDNSFSIGDVTNLADLLKDAYLSGYERGVYHGQNIVVLCNN